MNILGELVKKGIYDEFVERFGEIINNQMTIKVHLLEDAKSFLEDNGIDPLPNRARHVMIEQVIEPEEFKLYRWATVVNALLDVLESNIGDFDKFWFTYHASVLYTIDRKRLAGFPETVARVRAFIETYHVEPFRKVNGEIDPELLFNKQSYLSNVEHPYTCIRGNAQYFEKINKRPDAIGCP